MEFLSENPLMMVLSEPIKQTHQNDSKEEQHLIKEIIDKRFEIYLERMFPFDNSSI